MSPTPCERAQYTIIPNIRKELANFLIEMHELSQGKAAKLLGISSAAISQYRNNKRANNYTFPDEILIEIMESAQLIYEKGSVIVEVELCRLCKLTREKESMK